MEDSYDWTLGESGEICRFDGIWKVQGTPSTATVIRRGAIIPRFRGKKVLWRMIQHIPRKKGYVIKEESLEKEKEEKKIIVIKVE